MTEDLYAKALLRWAADARLTGAMEAPDARGIEINAMCGDRVQIDFTLDAEGHVCSAQHHTRACVLTQASAAILAAQARGAGHGDFMRLRDAVTAMLSRGEPAPGDPWADYAIFAPAAGHKSRHACVLLPIDAAIKALKPD